MKLNSLIKNLDPSKPTDKLVIDMLNSYRFNISKDILTERIKSGLSREEAANYINIPVQTYVEIERGQCKEYSKEKYLNVLKKLKEYVKDKELCLKVTPVYNKSYNYEIKSLSREKLKTNINETTIQWV